MLERPSKEAWESWLRSEVTQFYLTDINEVREALKETIVSGGVGFDDQLKGTIGVCEGLRRAIDVARHDFSYAGKETEGVEENELEGNSL